MPVLTRERFGVLVAGVMLLCISCGRAVAKNPVTSRAVVSDEPLVAGKSARIAVEIVIEKRFHVQGAKPLDEFLIPTLIEAKGVAGITAGTPRYPEATI